MFLPFDIADLHGAIQLAYNLIDIGWGSVNNAHHQYLEFKQDVEGLRDQLKTLQLAIELSQARTGALLAPRNTAHNSLRQLDNVFGNFKDTLEDCRRLLERKSVPRQGPVANVQWFLFDKDEVDMQRDRIAILTSKLSLALQSLEIETREGQTVLMLECTNLILERIDILDARLSRLLGVPLAAEGRRRIEVEQPLEDLLVSITVATYDSLTAIPMYQGIEETLFYWDRATRWHTRRRSAQPSQAFRLANILRAYWLLRTTKAGDEYLEATTTVSVERQIGQEFPQLGMTARRFVSNLEDRIVEAHTKLIQSGEPMPPLHQLQAVIEQDRDAWHIHARWKPPSPEDNTVTTSQRVATCRLRNGQLLDVYKEIDAPELLTVALCDANRMKQDYHRIDLGCLDLALSTEAVTVQDGAYTLALNSVKGRSQAALRLEFQAPEDLFGFQGWMTGYKVVDDFPDTVVTSQRANAWIGGERKSDRGRLQVWSSTRLSSGSKLPDEFIDKRKSTTAARRSTLSPYAPMLLPLASFSRFSLSLDSARPSTTQSMYLDAQAGAGPHYLQRQSRTPSLTGMSTVSSSSTSQSLPPSTVGDSKRPTNMIQVDRRGTMGCILDQPDPPRIVVLLPANENQGQRSKGAGKTASPGSLLVIDINQYVAINPTLCDCQQDHIPGQAAPPGHGRFSSYDSFPTAPPGQLTLPMTPPRHTLGAQPLECRKVILQVNGASGVTAKETDPGTDVPWNMASAGRFQSGEEMVGVKRLKMVGLEFASVEERVKFVEYFTILKRLYLKDLKF